MEQHFSTRQRRHRHFDSNFNDGLATSGHNANDSDGNEQNLLLRQGLASLSDLIKVYELGINDVNQAIADVHESASDSRDKVTSITEQLHLIIERREEELLDEIDDKSAQKLFGLDSQLTKLSQRLMFCREAKSEAMELLDQYDGIGSSSQVLASASKKLSARSAREHSGSTLIEDYDARKVYAALPSLRVKEGETDILLDAWRFKGEDHIHRAKDSR